MTYDKRCWHCKEHYAHSQSVHDEEIRLATIAKTKPSK